MLNKLDEINWKELEHAYGPAEDVPGQIRALASTDPQVREKAQYELWGNIIHQGTVYQATSYAVPFLIELLEIPEVQDKGNILCLLASLAYGSSYHDAHEPLFEEMGVFEEERGSPEWQLTIQEELGWVKAAHLAVIEGIHVYLKLLDNPEPETRYCAAYTLSVANSRASEIVPQMYEYLKQEVDNKVKASLLLSLGCLVETDFIPMFEEWLENSESPLVRAAAALSLVRVAGQHTPQAVIEVLYDILVNPEQIDEDYTELPWSDGENITSAVSVALGQLGSRAQSTVSRILDALEKLKPLDSGSISMVGTILALTFTPQKESHSVTDLTSSQYEILTRLAHSPRAWDWGNVCFVFQQFGLPHSQDKLISFLSV